MGDPFENMAVDEALLRLSREGPAAVTLRLYAWARPTVSLGYFQTYDLTVNDEACRRLGVAVVRRPTGGKAVYHDREVTYALVGREDAGFFPPDVLGTYRAVGEGLVRALGLLGLGAEMAPEGRPERGGGRDASCFAVPSAFEILVRGRKVCGSAQVRSRGAFLQHGSLLLSFDARRTGEVLAAPAGRMGAGDLGEAAAGVNDLLPEPVSREEVCEAVRRAFAEVFGVVLEEGGLTREEEAMKEGLLAGKYLTEGWNRQGGGKRL
ncbi:MAG TPA: biotin/lipoate A/B protein ligase family protein [Syntrophales bacterium]|nr:biotin/lipoate A/B protein ligase family protein [Syntrophales bacterium]HOM06340.1 biotin/lipoate A/B protein ligase family protein [Syntrophales bacterium]HON99221.1 biotin/lipoate A/B protein ligase family protein [Syntrophales bacterium]HPC00046.1 biotin/lipoate A/B protein ligase family protein [Syntrophales bacterium]HPQ05679.1 biotin/lipoate A/B protein ligase family protein [Syntrophales bacterium]